VTEHFSRGMGIIFVSGALNGSFALPMKYTRRWSWENTWFVFALVALVLVPWLLAVGFVPHLATVYGQARGWQIASPTAFGFLWGIAQCTFGLGIETVGMALAFSVVSGLACLSGSLVPLLVLDPGELFRPRGILLLISIPILLAALVFYGKAGRRREKEQRGDQSASSRVSYSFKAGLAICIFTGIVGSAWNVGFAFSGPVISASVADGVGPLTSTYAVWAVILSAGFVPNLIYCAYLLNRNRTWSRFGETSLRETMLGASCGFPGL
jgi:L-rhamnose-H+ transport protein